MYLCLALLGIGGKAGEGILSSGHYSLCSFTWEDLPSSFTNSWQLIFFFFNSKKQWEALVSWLCTCVCVWLLWMSIGGYSTVKWGVLHTRHITLVINSQTGLCQVPSGENGATTPSCLSQQRIRASVTRCWKSFANRRAMLWGSLLSSHTVSHSCLKPLGQFLHTFGLF